MNQQVFAAIGVLAGNHAARWFTLGCLSSIQKHLERAVERSDMADNVHIPRETLSPADQAPGCNRLIG
jgi:hypothetical protein